MMGSIANILEQHNNDLTFHICPLYWTKSLILYSCPMENILIRNQNLFKKEVIPRQWYYDRLDSLLKTKQIIVVQGQRRVGKSFIVMGYLKSLNIDLNSIFFFNKELDNKNMIKTNRELADLYDVFVTKHGEPEYIFIDEIQDIVERERFIRAKFVE
jgi:predicted AAA+ superfamily ATPase